MRVDQLKVMKLLLYDKSYVVNLRIIGVEFHIGEDKYLSIGC